MAIVNIGSRPGKHTYCTSFLSRQTHFKLSMNLCMMINQSFQSYLYYLNIIIRICTNMMYSFYLMSLRNIAGL